MNDEIRTIEQVEQWAAQQGIMLSPAERSKIAAIQSAERARLESTAATDQVETWADRWNDLFPRMLAAITTLGDTVMTIAQTVIVSLGVPLVLILLLVVEHRRVYHGIELFEVESALASFAAWALVLLNLVLEFQVHHVEHAAGYASERGARWSLRLWSQNMAYRLGIGQTWMERPLSPAERYRRLLRLVTFTILALALAGSMRSVIESESGAWHMAIGRIITDSTLSEITIWAGGLLFAAAAVLSAQGLSRYVAIRVVEIRAGMAGETARQADRYGVAVEAAGARAALAIINERMAKRRPLQVHSVNPTELAIRQINTTASTNGNGHYATASHPGSSQE